MGILDDAIRQHLDLKRRQGADESELQQLEDEAFGPPARPGEPDFPERTDGDGAEAADEAPVPAGAEAGEGPAVAEPSDHEPPHGDALLEDAGATPPEQPADVDEPVEDAAASSFTTAEREAIAEQPTVLFDHGEGDELELGGLDLGLDEDVEPVEEVEEPPPVNEPPPVDEIEVVEKTEPVSETDLPAEPEAAEPVAEPEPADAAEGDEPEDVLEETPEFLRDNPDDDELWFEQGEPKDFDF